MSSQSFPRSLLALTLGCMGIVVSTTPVQAQPIYQARMSGAEVVPPAPGGYCSIDGMFISDGQIWSCSDSPDHLLAISSFYSGLSGPPTGCYLHRGAAGVNGERLYTIHAGFFPPNYPNVTITIDPTDCVDLENQNLYVVITTELYPDGEARGQVVVYVMGAVESTTWGRIKTLYR